MRNLLWVLAAGGAVIFMLSLLHFTNHYSLSGNSIQIEPDSLKGFRNKSPVPGLEELEKAYQTKIAASKATNEKQQHNWLVVSFIVVALTAGSTLVSSISATKSNEEPGHKRALIIVAVLTFLASLGTWWTTQLNDAKTAAATKTSLIIQKRNQFYLDFEKAQSDEERVQVVQAAKRDLDTV